MNSLALSDISVRFGAVQALAGVGLTIGKGETVMMVGPNGAGKTTLARVLLGLVRPQQGTITLDGKPHAVDRTFKAQLGYLPEAVAFSDNLKGRQVLRFFARARGVPVKQADLALERVGLSHAANRAVRGYSRGMRQRLGIAVAILAAPELLILDEPTGGLDQEGLAVLWSVLAEWRDKGRMVLLSSHQLALLERRIDRLCVFRAGHVVATGTPASLREQAGVRQRVSLSLAPDAPEEVAAFVAAVKAWDGASTEVADHCLVCETAGDGLLPLMDIRGRFTRAVTAMSVEEPTLEMVYERLLERS